jgi:hypothetical protein
MREDFCENCGFDIEECACCPECGEFDGCLCELEEDPEYCPDCGSHGMLCTCYDDEDLEDIADEDDDEFEHLDFDADDFGLDDDYCLYDEEDDDDNF